MVIARPAPRRGGRPKKRNNQTKKEKHCSRIKKIKNILVIPAQAGIGTKQCERQRTNYILRATGFKDPIPAYAGMTKEKRGRPRKRNKTTKKGKKDEKIYNCGVIIIYSMCNIRIDHVRP